jgi:hypothetical protein
MTRLIIQTGTDIVGSARAVRLEDLGPTVAADSGASSKLMETTGRSNTDARGRRCTTRAQRRRSLPLSERSGE